MHGLARRALVGGSILTAATAGAMVVPPSAFAATCAFDTGTHNLTVTTAKNDVVLAAVNGSIFLDGVECADVAETATISVTAVGPWSQDLTIENPSAFAPGFVSDPDGIAAIGFLVDMGAGFADTVALIGRAGSETFTAGNVGINLDADGDMDVTLVGVERLHMEGDAGDDAISAGGGVGAGKPFGGSVTILGGSGYDVLEGGDAGDVIAGTGLDMLPVDFGVALGGDVLRGGRGDDRLLGTTDLDFRLDIASWVDTLEGGQGSDYLAGGAGRDIYTWEDHTTAVTVILDNRANDGPPGTKDRVVGDDFGETVIGGSGDDTLIGDVGFDTLVGGPGNDVLRGEEGNDRLDGGLGDDVLDGGDDAGTAIEFDLAWYADRPSTISASIGDGANDGDPLVPERDDIQATVEGVMGGRGDDVITGDSSANLLFGFLGSDVVNGGGGNDELRGDFQAFFVSDLGDLTLMGDDVLNGGDGGDRLFGDGRADTLRGGAGNDVLAGDGFESSVVAGDDLLMGQEGDDELYGWWGNDSLDGGIGADHMEGHDGDDFFLARDGTVDELLGGIDTDSAEADKVDVLSSIEILL